MTIADLETFDPKIIRAHSLYYFRYDIKKDGKLVISADIWWSTRYHRYVANCVTDVIKSFTVADADFNEFIRKLNEAAINT